MLPFLLALASSVTVQPIDADRFRLTIIYGGRSAYAHAEAQMKLIGAAEGLCKGRGRAVSEEALMLNEVSKADKATRKKGRLSLSQEWRCVRPL